MRAPRSHRRTHLILTLAAALVAAAGIGPLAAQSANPRERTMFVSAVDDRGEPVEGLGPEAFVITEDGRRREVLRVSRATEPIDIALIVDNSQAASDAIPYMRESLARFVAAMAPAGSIAVITISDRPTIAADYTSDPKRLSDAVGRLFSMRETGATLLDAIVETAEGLRRRETPRAVIVAVVTDGVEFTNRYSTDAIRALVDARAALHLATIGPFYHSEEHSIRERSFFIDEGPRRSGGQRLSMLSPMGLDVAMQRLGRQLRSQYKVVYGRPESLIPPDKVEISSGKAALTMRGAPARGEKGA
jgi:VWFA-related protein